MSCEAILYCTLKALYCLESTGSRNEKPGIGDLCALFPAFNHFENTIPNDTSQHLVIPLAKNNKTFEPSSIFYFPTTTVVQYRTCKHCHVQSRSRQQASDDGKTCPIANVTQQSRLTYCTTVLYSTVKANMMDDRRTV